MALIGKRIIISGADFSDVKIGEKITYNIITSITNGALTGAETIREGSTVILTFEPLVNYVYPLSQSIITVLNADILSYNSGVLVISNPTGDVTITATCPESPQMVVDNQLSVAILKASTSSTGDGGSTSTPGVLPVLTVRADNARKVILIPNDYMIKNITYGTNGGSSSLDTDVQENYCLTYIPAYNGTVELRMTNTSYRTGLTVYDAADSKLIRDSSAWKNGGSGVLDSLDISSYPEGVFVASVFSTTSGSSVVSITTVAEAGYSLTLN